MKIESVANEYVIPINSLIAFEEDVIRYYATQNNTLIFKDINDVDYNSQVIIKNIEDKAQTSLDNNAQNDVKKVDNIYNYEELLTSLEIIENAKNGVENSQEEIEQEDLSENKTEENKKDDTENEVDSNEQKEEQLENSENVNTKFVKPEVTAEPFTAEVYSAKSTLQIKDTTARIVEAPTFEIYKEGKLYLRRVFKSSGEIQITGLVPETEYEIIGKYIYLNAEGKKIENTFYKGNIKTKGYEALGTIEISKEEGEIYSNKIQIKNLKITSDLQNEAIKGINQIELETGNIRTVLKHNKLNELLQGNEITIESSEGLQSNKNIDYAIKFYDKNGIELSVANNLGKTKTSKQKPSVKITTKKQDIVSVTLGLKLSNKDKVKLENYKYIITRPNGEKLKEERLSENEKEIKLEDLDQNQYYKITICADYDLGDNKGIQQNVELGNLVFATKPISTLGSLELKMENKELTSTSTKLEYKIYEERTDKRLIQILNGIEITIKEKLEDTQEKSKKITYEHILTEEEIISLKQGNYNIINCENLQANTTYEIDIKGTIKLGKTEEEIPITYTYKEFTTLKIPAKIEIKNQFVTGNLIDFDVRIDDPNNSVLNNKVRMELRDEKSNLLDLQEIETNEDYVRKTYEKLNGNHRYKLSFYADQYNIGNTDKTYKVNYLIKEIEIITEQGISGSIGLTELTKKATGKNLVDVSSNIKWYVYPNFNTGDYYGKEYNEETKILTLGGHGNYRRAVYDLREYAGQEVTMSFKAKAVSGKQNAYIQNSKKDANRTALEGLTEEWKEYQCTLNVDDTGYLGFYVAGGNGIEIKELQVELGNRKTNYEEFKNMLQSNFIINLEDKKNEITTNDYYIKIYKEDELVQEERYEEIPENNIVENEIKTYATEAGKKYVIKLSIKIKEREYLISEIEYSTKEMEEIKGIYNVQDFLEIQPYGNYIVLNDLDFTGTSYCFGYEWNGMIQFNGKLNFNGHKIVTDVSNDNKSTLIASMGTKGIIENLILDIKYNNDKELSYSGFIIKRNYGTIRNIKVNLIESNKNPNYGNALIIQKNEGTIENFVINLEETMYTKSEAGVVCNENTGIIKNGYVYGKNVNSDFVRNDGSSANIGIITRTNSGNGEIKNVYSLVNIDVSNQENINNSVGNIVNSNSGNALVENVYSVGIGKNITKKTAGPNIYYADGKISNNYYFNDEIFTNKYHKKTTMLALHDTKFQSQILNSENSFNVAEYVSKGYYPQLRMPSVMPNNEYIKLPEVKDVDLADILSTEIVTQGIDTVEVKFNVYNPSAETITNIKIKNLECTILSQTYENKRSEIVAKLHSPKLYTSTYSVLGITTQGAFNIPYTREFLENERTIEVDLYKKINNISEWQDINKSPTENYILMQDLNFANMGTR